MGDEALRNKVISNLRACLISAKGGVSFSELNSDYRKIVGESIPYRKLGFPSLEDFLQDVDGLVITRKGADWNVAAKPTEDTIHLTKLIAKQKSAPKRRSRGPTVRHRRPAASAWRRPVTWNTSRPMHHVSRDQHMSHRQSQRSPNIVPLMSLHQKRPTVPLYEKPRYMLPNSGMPHISPSKRFSDRMANSGVINSSNNSTNNNNHGPCIAYKNKAAVQASINQTTTPIAPSPSPSPVQSQVPTPRPGNSRDNSTLLKPLSERLKAKMLPQPEPPTILSPLSPSRLVNGAGAANSQIQVTPVPRQMQNTPTRINASQTTIPQDPCKHLELLASGLKLGDPVYRITTWGPENKQSCNVKVGNISYSSYPEETSTPEEARKIAAKKMIAAILEKDGPLHGLSKTTNKNLVKERVIAIVAEHENGVFMHQIPKFYKEQYKENLPEEWEKIIEECSDIFKEKGTHDQIILRPYVARTEANDPEKAVDALSPRLEKIQLSPIGPPVPDTLRPPSEQYWDVSITSVLSTIDIWARLIGEEYSEKLDSMLNDMEYYYKKQTPISNGSSIEVRSYYAVQEEETFHRVQCFDFDSRTGKAEVFFIDHGDEDSIHYSKLYPLEKKFCAVPAQAVNLSLAGLEEFHDCLEVMEYLEELLLGEPLIAQVVSRDNLDEDDWVASVVLYDTRNPSDVNLNEVLLRRIFENILVPKLNQDGVSEVYVSHVAETGDVYLQMKSRSLYYLTNMLNKLIQTGLTAEDVKRSEPEKIVTGKIYLARCFEDGNWYRGVVTNIGANYKIKIFLIDMGKTIIVDKKIHLLELDQLSEVLTKYPYQAIKVRLHKVPETMFNAEMIAKLVTLAPPKDQLLAKVITSGSISTPPVVELFKRYEKDNLLASINASLTMDPEFIGSGGDGNNNHTRPRKRLERTISRHGITGDGESSTRNLKPPKIPGFGEYFDVHITMAANPGNFTVQPYDDKINLEAMMVQLQEVCMNYSGPVLSHEIIKEGSLYAAKHIDGHFYRVCISKILDEQIVTVYFCDFGDVSVLTLDKLQPLGRQFLDLPYQAIRARLVGVQPLNMDWSVEDCLRFQELVVERNFVSIVVDSGPDRLSPGDTVLGLRLIDVSGKNDVRLDELLITEGRATAIEA